MINNSFRPVSPNLAVYKPQASSLQSIFHRISGFLLVLILYTGTYFIHLQSYLINSIRFDESYFLELMINILLNIVLLALCYHILNGIRYIISWKI